MKRKKLVIQIGVIIIFCGIIIIFIRLPYLFFPKEYLSVRQAGTPGGNENMAFKNDYPFTQEGIRQSLTSVKDPEIDLNIIDLGLIRDIQIEENNKVSISIIFTSPLCPLTQFIIKQIEETVINNFDVKKVEVNVDETTLWNIDMMTEEGRKRLEEYFK